MHWIDWLTLAMLVASVGISTVALVLAVAAMRCSK